MNAISNTFIKLADTCFQSNCTCISFKMNIVRFSCIPFYVNMARSNAFRFKWIWRDFQAFNLKWIWLGSMNFVLVEYGYKFHEFNFKRILRGFHAFRFKWMWRGSKKPIRTGPQLTPKRLQTTIYTRDTTRPVMVLAQPQKFQYRRGGTSIWRKKST